MKITNVLVKSLNYSHKSVNCWIMRFSVKILLLHFVGWFICSIKQYCAANTANCILKRKFFSYECSTSEILQFSVVLSALRKVERKNGDPPRYVIEQGSVEHSGGSTIPIAGVGQAGPIWDDERSSPVQQKLYEQAPEKSIETKFTNAHNTIVH